MAYSSASLTAQETSDLGNDYPLAWSTHAVRAARNDGSFAVDWRVSGSFASGSDATDATFSTTATYDDSYVVPTRPTSSSTLWYLMFNLGTTSATFDSLAILGHNFGSNSASCVVQIADDNAFTSNLATIASFDPTDDKRLISLQLGPAGPLRYTGVVYIRLLITAASGFIPQVGEVWLGRRKQLHSDPRLGHNPDGAGSGISDTVAASGYRTRYVYFRDRKELEANWLTNTQAQHSAILDLFNDTEDGTRPFVYVPNPNSASTVAYVMHWNNAQVPGGDQQGPIRRWSFSMSEQAQFYDREG